MIHNTRRHPSRAGRRARAGAALLLGLVAAVPLTGLGATEASAAPSCDSADIRAVGSLSADELAAAAVASGRSESELRELGKDASVSIDGCGRLLFVEPKVVEKPQINTLTPAPFSPVVPLAQTFILESLPGSDRTIYLDFTGDTVEKSGWNDVVGKPSFSVRPFSFEGSVDTAFTDAELAEIQKIWISVAEDFAPFDVNVTLRDPGANALTRSSPADPTFGTAVDITDAAEPLNGCGCGGRAYVGVFDGSFDVGRRPGYYQPAFVLTSSRQTKVTAEAISHEVGHALGLTHDGVVNGGTTVAEYYRGAAPWAPIMGTGYDQPVTQWSKGEYPGANNRQDDIAVIAKSAPLRADDHGDTKDTATALPAGATAKGVITSEGDADAFTFTAAGPVTVTAEPAFAAASDLDIELTVLDADGAVVATVDRPTERAMPDGPSEWSEAAKGLDAVWTADVPKDGRRYTAVVRGTGHGTPGAAGSYSRYGSTGAYQLSLQSATPVKETFTSVATGSDHSVGIAADGTLYAWGQNGNGRLGDGTTTARSAPVPVLTPAGVTFTQVSAGKSSTVAIGSNGKTYAWGLNNAGQLGDGSTTDRHTPVEVKVPANVRFTSVSAGGDHSLALGSDGKTYGWGFNGYGQLGDGRTTTATTPVVVAAPAGVAFTTVEAGGRHSVALGSDGKTYTWGLNSRGELGVAGAASSSVPIAVPTPAGVRFTRVTSGFEDTVAFGSDGNVYTWGPGNFETLADGTGKALWTPSRVKTPAGVTVTQVSLGSRTDRPVAIASDGNGYEWPGAVNGALAAGPNTDWSGLTRVQLPSGVTFTGLDLGSSHAVATGSDGNTYSWGASPNGQLGTGSSGVVSAIPVKVNR